jgi:regulator of sigma E protease
MVLAAGPAANLLTALVILWAAFMLGGPDTDRTRILEINPGSPAEAAGLLPDDIVQWRTYPGPNGEPSLSQMLRLGAGRPVEFEIERDGVRFMVELTPRLAPPEGEGPAGFTSKAVVRPHAPLEAAGRAGETLTGVLRSTFAALTGQEAARLVGPLGLKQASDQSVEGSIRWSSLYPLLYLAALIQIGLGLTNLLPIPALDGGRLAILGIEALGLRLTPRLAKVLVGGSAIALVCLMAALTVRDVIDPLV